MDDRQKVIRKTFSREQLLTMPIDDLMALAGRPGAVFRGTGVVRKADGTIRYDEDAVPGQFGESTADLA